MKIFYLSALREAQVLAVLVRAAGLAPLALTGACADRTVDDTAASAGEVTGATTTAATTGATTETTAATETTTTAATETTVATLSTGPQPTSDSFDCPIDYYDTVECFDPPPPGSTTGASTGDDTGAGRSTDEGLSTTGDGTTTGTTGTTGDTTSGTTSGTTTSDGSTGTTGAGLCDGFEPSIGGDCGLWPMVVSDPFEQRGQCCVNVTWESSCCGRPFLVEETARTARAIRRADWCASAPPQLAGLSERQRAALAAEWREDALTEHASVAAFARFVLQLLAVGAPPSLVIAAQQAMAEEIVHAQLCFGLASAYGGAPVGPSALPLAGVLAGAEDLATVAAATLREGCIGETIAALQAETALGHAEDPAVRAALTQIAADELRHAELGWRFVAWALERGGPQVHAACVAALATAEAAIIASEGHVDTDMSEELVAHGRLGLGGRAAVARRALQTVIGPAARALLDRHAPAAAA